MKKRILILALLIFIVSMGCASAAEDNSTDALTLDDSSEVLTSEYGGNFGELADLIENADEGDTITLKKDYNGSGQITIGRGLVIDGAGHSINANFESRIFLVDSESEVLITNTIFSNGFDEYEGGAIYAYSPLYIYNCEFYYNGAYDMVEYSYGGAIYAGDELGILNSYFEGNFATMGGAIYSENYLIINNTGFLNNYANSGGGAISGLYSNMIINASGFENNTAEGYGGSIFAGQILQLTNSFFISGEDEVDIIDYYNYDEADDSIYLYLENNTMYTPYAYSIWYESLNRILSPVNLAFTKDEAENGDVIEIARVMDDMGNIIRYDYDVTMEIYDGNTLVDTVELEYDMDNKGYYYECDLDNGTYTLTGSLSSDYVAKINVYEGQLVVGSTSEKTATTLSAAYTLNGNSVTLTATVAPSDATGTVTFSIAGNDYTAKVNKGKATKTLSNLEDGSYTVKTSYGGDDNYKASVAKTISFTVSTSSSSEITIDAPELTKYYRDSDKFVVTLKEDGVPLSGETVTIIINNVYYDRTTNTQGQASMSVNLAPGVYPVTVKAEGEQTTSKITVLKATPKVTAAYELNGNSVTLTAELNATSATGTVSFNVNNKNYDADIENGKATKTLSNLEDGSYTVKTTYSGDEYYNSANAKQISFTVGGTPGEKTTPSVTASYEQNQNSVTLTAELDPSDASGTVTFNVNNRNYNAEVTNGKATRTLNKLADGIYTVKTSYSGDANYNSANAKQISFTIGTPAEKTTPTVTTSYTKDSSTVVTLTTTVSPSDATGTVTYIINGEEYNPVAVTNGKATKRLSGLEDGSYTVKTSYSGDNNYNSANAKQVSFVIASTGVNIDAPELVKYYGGSERFTVTLTENGEPLSGKTVKITINGQTYERTTDSSGKAGMNVNLNSKEYPVTVEAEGQKVSSKVTVKPTVDGKDITKIFRNGTQYYATFVDTQGNLLRNTDVNFNINGVFYTRKTDGNGVARMNINLNPQTYVITAKNPVTGEQYTNTITVLTNIIEHNDLTKYYKNDSQYRIRILADDGSIAKAGVKVTFNINGVFYDRYSDDNGYVQMRINLNPGDYIITADYNGLKASNNIKVLNILFGNNVNMEYKDGSKYTVKLLDGHGNPYSGQTVDLNINGVFYKRVTGSDGVASLNINLEGGSYVITASYNGLSCSNTVNVVVPMSEYTVGNFKFSIPKSCNVDGGLSDDNTVFTYTIDYTNGQRVYVSFEYVSSVPLSYIIDYIKSQYGAQEMTPYNGWVILDCYNAVRRGYFETRYYAFSEDGTYVYQIQSNDLGLCQQIISSFH